MSTDTTKPPPTRATIAHSTARRGSRPRNTEPPLYVATAMCRFEAALQQYANLPLNVLLPAVACRCGLQLELVEADPVFTGVAGRWGGLVLNSLAPFSRLWSAFCRGCLGCMIPDTVSVPEHAHWCGYMAAWAGDLPFPAMGIG